MIYLHDGLFDGFLTCIYEHYYAQAAEGIYDGRDYEPRLFEETKQITTDSEKAKKVYQAILTKLSEATYWDIFYTFLSCEKEKDCYLLKFIVEAFKIGRAIDQLHTMPFTYDVKRLSRKVGFERHRFLGILRFMDIGGCLYAPFEPDNDVLMTLANHFADRFANERFIIHDKKRKKALISNYSKWIIVDFDLNLAKEAGEREILFQNLWQTYFDAVGIESRENKPLQKKFIPLKYRKHIQEFK